MVNWPDDLALRDAHNDMITQIERIQGSTPSTAAHTAAHTSELHMNCVLALDPEKIDTEYQRIFKAALQIGDNELAAGQIALTRDHLAAWRGDAADQFRLQLTYMNTFCETEQDLLLEALQGVAATYAASVAARISLRNLLEATADAARNVFDSQRTRETQAAIAVVADVVAGVLSGDPKSPVKSVTETLVNLGKDLATIAVDDSGADQVCNSYTREGEHLCQQLGQAYDAINGRLVRLRDEAAKAPELFRPLPAYCDVKSPDFTYERFKDTIHDPGPIGPKVEVERQKYADEKNADQSEIDRRLNRGDHGAV